MFSPTLAASNKGIATRNKGIAFHPLAPEAPEPSPAAAARDSRCAQWLADLQLPRGGSAGLVDTREVGPCESCI